MMRKNFKLWQGVFLLIVITFISVLSTAEDTLSPAKAITVKSANEEIKYEKLKVELSRIQKENNDQSKNIETIKKEMKLIKENDNRWFWNLLVNVAVAVGTILLALVAFNGPRKPKLEIRLEKKSGIITNEYPIRYYHLNVLNNDRKAPAEDVRVYLLKIEELTEKGRGTLWENGMALMKWRDEHESIDYIKYRDKNGNEFDYANIKSIIIGPVLDVDLCRLEKVEDPSFDCRLNFGFLYVPKTLKTEYHERTKKCVLIATFQAKSISGDSPKSIVKIEWNGEWSKTENDMLKIMKVSIIKEKDLSSLQYPF